MENLPFKILKLNIHDDCPQELIEPTQAYWELNEELKFKFNPEQIKNKFSLNTDVSRYGALEYETYCFSCSSEMQRTARSRGNLNGIVGYLKSGNANLKCNECKAEERRKKRKEKKEKDRKLREQEHRKKEESIERVKLAVEEKAWRRLTPFEFNVLKKCLTLDSFFKLTQFYWNKFQSRADFKKLFTALKNIADKDLLLLEYEFDHSLGFNKTINYKYIYQLKEKFEYDYMPEKEEKNIKNGINKDKSTSSSHLKLKLTKNDLNQHPDAPKYAGTITFKEEIIIKPNVQYTFAQWERSNNELYFTLMPIEDIENLPAQKRLYQEPQELQEVITEFFNEMGNNLKF